MSKKMSRIKAAMIATGVLGGVAAFIGLGCISPAVGAVAVPVVVGAVWWAIYENLRNGVPPMFYERPQKRYVFTDKEDKEAPR